MIESGSGEKFYFRREARGLNYDSLSLSKNANYCSEPDKSTDIVFRGLGPNIIFYKFEGDELHLYLTSLVEVPKAFSENIKIVQHKLNNPEFIYLFENYKSKNLNISNIEIDETLKC